tara:strand:- start:82 stop:348 length:267 start_codon:yes stop_codon:yes gene_type:complete
MCLEMRLTMVMPNPVPLVFVVKADFAQALIAIFGVGADPIESHGVVLEDRTRQLFTIPTALFSPFMFGDVSTKSSIVSGKSTNLIIVV